MGRQYLASGLLGFLGSSLMGPILNHPLLSLSLWHTSCSFSYKAHSSVWAVFSLKLQFLVLLVGSASSLLTFFLAFVDMLAVLCPRIAQCGGPWSRNPNPALGHHVKASYSLLISFFFQDCDTSSGRGNVNASYILGCWASLSRPRDTF